MNQRKSLRSFTRVELLVVIALIVILVGLMLQLIGRTRKIATFSATMNQGRGLFQMLSAEKIDWPADDITKPDLSHVQEDFPSSSTALFASLKNSGKLNVDWAFFAAPGVPAAPGTGPFTAENNAWCVTLDLGENSKANIPFLFTKNIQGNTLAAIAKDPKLSGVPFGREACMVIYFGGGAVKLGQNDLAAFNPSGASNAVLRP